MKKIFISHASLDVPIVNALIDDLLVGSLSVKVGDIFCTTTDGMKIKSGEDWRESIKEALQQSLVTILLITPNYKESEVCLCEMGAAWVTSSKVLPFIVDPINYSDVGIIQQPKQIEKLLDEKSLDRLRDEIQTILKIDPKDIKSDRWTVKKIEFLQKVKSHLTKNPFILPLSRNEFDNVLNENLGLHSAVQSLIEEKSDQEAYIQELKKAKDQDEIKIIEKKHKKTSSIDEFSELCKNVTRHLSKLSSIIRGIAFVSYSGKNIRIGYQGWRDEIDEAFSRDYITDDSEADWETSKLMRDLHEALHELDFFLRDKYEDSDFIREYEENFEAPLSLSNLEFWEEAFNLGISIS
ncbi:MAG: toll/interleukin-1 receptor domain-containing protein [Proteobacteria bacterium]|nr:toll/interleukin-1 receptor domain-containing protein [Pseudomonadota bacterium]MCG2747396.1 toll/interleukin-1 receptor domain-containing protein [Desulfobulbaceae bacterium]